MDNEELHYPPGAEPEKPTEPEAPQKPEAPKEEPAGDEPPETPKADEPKDDQPEGKEPEGQEPKVTKPRSIYDDYKEKKQEARTEKERADTAEARVIELEALLQAGKQAQTPSDQAAADEDIRKFAEENDLDPEGLAKITNFLQNKLGGEKVPADVQKELDDLRTWKESQQADAKRIAEDREIEAHAPKVRETLKSLGHDIHVDAEADAVMNEVKRLAHTKEFHDKPIDFIVWSKREELAKMISPRKPSFESSTPNTGQGEDTPVDFSSGRVTPLQAQTAMTERKTSAYDIRQVRE